MSPLHDVPDGVVRFRQERLTPGALLAGLTDTPASKKFLSIQAGLGKSFALAGLVCHPPVYERFDRVLLMVDQNRTLNELRPRLVQDLPRHIRDATIYLAPRPRADCGDRDGRWVGLEAAGCGALARSTLCATCPHGRSCAWLLQADGQRLANARLVVGVQTYLRLYGELLVPLPDARKTLLVLDEVVAVTEPKTRRITRGDLRVLLAVCQHLADQVPVEDARRLARLERVAQHLVSRRDPRRLPGLPALGPDLDVAIQKIGEKLNTGVFRNIVPDLQQLRRRGSVWYTDAGDLAWHEPLPVQPHTVLVATTGAPLALVREKLALPDLVEMYPNVGFVHPGTRFFNLQTRHGARRNFHTHAPQLLDLFAGLTVQELKAGRKVALLACKEHLGLCKAGIEERIRALTGETVTVEVPDNRITVLEPTVRVALVSYGITGSNALENFDTCLALDSYYVSDKVVEEQLADLLVGNARCEVSITDDEDGLRQLVCHTENPTLREAAQALYEHLEAGVVLQAIGRVRPTIHPRTVVIQQRTRLGLGYHAVFHTLDQARKYFAVESRRVSIANTHRDRVADLRRAGLKQVDVAQHLGISLRTVKRHWRCHEP